MNLRILKENEEGFGIIIDKESGSIGRDLNLNLTESYQKLDLSAPLIYYATLQKYGVENRNGRIYPEDILRREVERYQEVIRKNASFHELDHPDCVQKTCEILTDSGWKRIDEISDDEDILTLNPNTNEIEVQKITKKITQPYKGKMIRISGRNIDVTVTPNHKFWIINKRTRLGKFVTAQEIHNKTIKSCGDYYIPKRGNWCGVNKEFVVIPGIPKNKLGKRCSDELVKKYSEDLIIDAITFYQFMGIWLSEGSVQGSRGDSSYGYKISITQKKEENIQLIRGILEKTKLYWGRSGTDFVCSDARLHNYLKVIGNSETKFIPKDLKNASPFLLNELFEMFVLGDGRKRGFYNKVDVFSVSKKLIDDLHEILIKIGGSGTIREENRQFDRCIGERLIKGENCHNMWFLSVSSTDGVWLDVRNLKTEEIDYDDFVYCVEVPNHIWYFRDNGKSAWTGNSSVISLKGGSPHRILELIWKDNVLIGKLEILVSEGYRRSGVISCHGDLVAHYLSYGMTLGISSRGVGSLKKVNGKNMVQDDFELICWDIVSSPSTPGSYLYKDINDFAKYDEMTVNNEPAIAMGRSGGGDEEDFMERLSSFLKK